MALTRISAFRNGPKRQVALVILGLALLSHAAHAEGGQVNLAWDANIQSILGGYTQGRFGKALLFDGVNDWVTGNDAGSLDLTTGMTLEARATPP